MQTQSATGNILRAQGPQANTVTKQQSEEADLHDYKELT